MKRILSAFLAVLMVISLLPITVLAEENEISAQEETTRTETTETDLREELEENDVITPPITEEITEAQPPVDSDKEESAEPSEEETADNEAPEEEIDALLLEDSHEGHDTFLQEIALGQQEIDFCGIFYCNTCGTEYTASITEQDIGMPILNLSGDISKATKAKKVNVEVSYFCTSKSFTSAATVKLQGSSSINYPKKNYTLQLLKDDGSKNKVKLVDSWGKQSKYCLKANWVDASHARNVVSGKLFSQIIHSRGINDQLNALGNGGVVDGFPIVIYNNGVFHGLYTLNIPKDKWMFGMSDEGHQALLFADQWHKSTALRETINVSNPAASCWEVEYCSTEDTAEGTSWAIESMNKFITFLLNTTGPEFIENIDHYTDVERAIDVLIFTFFSAASDNFSKNVIWATYDGIKWIPSVYDLDATWGMFWDGSFPSDIFSQTLNFNDANVYSNESLMLLMQRLIEHFPAEIKARYATLRGGILSEANVNAAFNSFFSSIPSIVYEAEEQKWPSVPNNAQDAPEQINAFVHKNAAALDSSILQMREQIFSTPIPSLTEGTHILVLNGKEIGEYRFAKFDSGWTIQDGSGYLTVSNARLTHSSSPAVWNFSNNRFSFSVKSGLLISRTTTYYLAESFGKLTVLRTTLNTAASFKDRVCRHAAGQAIKEHIVDATCLTEGSYEAVTACTKCGKELSRTTVSTEKLVHTPAEPVKQNEVAATCATAGGYDDVVSCSVCNTEIFRDHTDIPALGHTPAETWDTVVVTTPTCTKAGSSYDVLCCTVCGDEIERSQNAVLPALGHKTAPSKLEQHNGKWYNVSRCSVCQELLSEQFAGEITANVSVTKQTKTILFFFKSTSYHVAIEGISTIPGIYVQKVQYSTNNRTWTTGTDFTSSSEPKTLYIRITDSIGSTTNFLYRNGVVTEL